MKKKLFLGLLCLITLPVWAGGELSYKIGLDYLIQRNYKEALFWLNKAADDGNVDALSSIALCYYGGFGVEQNYKQALEWYKKAAEKGDGNALHMIGTCYMYGLGVKMSTSKAIKYYQEAVDKNCIYAMTDLANCYYNGLGVKCNKPKAVALWTQAAELGESSAQLQLSSCYAKGDGVDKDQEKSIYWCKKAAEQGNAQAQYKYANFCIDSDNYEEAAIWLLKASNQGHEQAKNQLELVTDFMHYINVNVGTANDTTNVEEIFVVVDTMPEFPGGVSAMMKYLSENIKYPVIAQENGIQGRVICQFVVEKDGRITNIQVLRSSGEKSLDKEAVRVISTMPNWSPGSAFGKPVRVKYTIPINFRLEDDKTKRKKGKNK